MWDAYWQTVLISKLDFVILGLGGILIAVQFVGLVGHYISNQLLFVQYLDQYRNFCLLVTELLPVLGLLGTVFSLMDTFNSFQAAGDGETPDLSKMVRTFAPALSTTISGLMMIAPNLLLNALLGLACEIGEKGQGEP